MAGNHLLRTSRLIRFYNPNVFSFLNCLPRTGSGMPQRTILIPYLSSAQQSSLKNQDLHKFSRIFPISPFGHSHSKFCNQSVPVFLNSLSSGRVVYCFTPVESRLLLFLPGPIPGSCRRHCRLERRWGRSLGRPNLK